jgi:hypothetical protein
MLINNTSPHPALQNNSILYLSFHRKGDLLSLASFYKDVKTKTMGDVSNSDFAYNFGRPGSIMQRRRSEEEFGNNLL